MSQATADLGAQLACENGFDPQKFRERPRLERAAARHVRRFGIGDFRNVPKAGMIEVFKERREKALTCFRFCHRGFASDAHPSFDERSH